MPEDDRTPISRAPREAKGGGVSTGVFQNTVDRFADFAESGQATQAAATKRTTTMLTVIIVVQALILAMVVAGLVNVGITGHIPGVGDIEIAAPGAVNAP